MNHRVTLVPGDSVGPEVAVATQRLIAAAGVQIQWDLAEAGAVAVKSCGDAMPAATLESIQRNRVALKGRVSTPLGKGYESPNVRLRKTLELYAAVRPIRSQAGLKSRYDDVDLVIIREATEDVYAGIEHVVVPGVVQSMKVTTRVACERVIRFAFEYARSRNRHSVTIVHKANIMKKSDGLFLEVGNAVSAAFPGIECRSIIADNACMQLVKEPDQFDVLVSQNLFGDLLSDLAAGLVGGISGVYGVMRGDSDVHVFEAIHGFAPEIEGKGLANPLTFIQPACAMLRHLGEATASEMITRSVGQCLSRGESTRDLGGTLSTEGFVDAVIAEFQSA